MRMDCGQAGRKVAEVGREQIAKVITDHKRSLDFIVIAMESQWQALNQGVTRSDLIKRQSFCLEYIMMHFGVETKLQMVVLQFCLCAFPQL